MQDPLQAPPGTTRQAGLYQLIEQPGHTVVEKKGRLTQKADLHQSSSFHLRTYWNEKVTNHGSIPITIDCNAVAIVFEEGFHQPIKRTKQSVFLDVTVFRHTLVD
ncbi:hypothetical protein TNCV_1459211 [Trichonephila clavipes]|nr:hypothetical protein TNCV_1459211 [Trichonephila clavipes]